jgi:hypothetical protein
LLQVVERNYEAIKDQRNTKANRDFELMLSF